MSSSGRSKTIGSLTRTHWSVKDIFGLVWTRSPWTSSCETLSLCESTTACTRKTFHRQYPFDCSAGKQLPFNGKLFLLHILLIVSKLPQKLTNARARTHSS